MQRAKRWPHIQGCCGIDIAKVVVGKEIRVQNGVFINGVAVSANVADTGDLLRQRGCCLAECRAAAASGGIDGGACGDAGGGIHQGNR